MSIGRLGLKKQDLKYKALIPDNVHRDLATLDSKNTMQVNYMYQYC